MEESKSRSPVRAVPVSKPALIACVFLVSVVLSCFLLFGQTFARESIAHWNYSEPGVRLPERTLAAPAFAKRSLVVPGILFLCGFLALFRSPDQLAWLVHAVGIAALLTVILFVVVVSWAMLPSMVVIVPA